MTQILSHGFGGYRRGCRCGVCRDANNVKARLWRKHGTSAVVHLPRVGFLNETPGIDCRCGEPITPCDGRHGEWKHIETNREQCGDGGYASPASAAWRAVPCV